MYRKSLAAAALLALAGCSALPPVVAQPADPAVVARIKYVCAYSGLFKFANSAVLSLVPVPGVNMGADLVNAGVTQICLNPEKVAADEATVANLIRQFKAAGKM